jgi:hypothetical protein
MHGMEAKSVSPVADRFCGKTYQKESLTVLMNNSTSINYRQQQSVCRHAVPLKHINLIAS